MVCAVVGSIIPLLIGLAVEQEVKPFYTEVGYLGEYGCM